MNQRTKTARTKKRVITYLWVFGLAVAVFLLIYFERTELLYILATLGVTALLVVVAATDLGRGESTAPGLSDAQASGSGISSKPPDVSKK